MLVAGRNEKDLEEKVHESLRKLSKSGVEILNERGNAFGVLREQQYFCVRANVFHSLLFSVLQEK